GKALAKWQAELVSDLGGDLSTQQRVLVDLCVRSKLIIDSIDMLLLSQKSLISYRKKAVIPVVRERQIIADGLTRNLQLLGLDRKARQVSWEDTLKEIAAETEKAASNGNSVDSGESNSDNADGARQA